MAIPALVQTLSALPAVTRFYLVPGPNRDTQLFAFALARPEDLTNPYEANADYKDGRVVPRVVDYASLGDMERVLFRWGSGKGAKQILGHALSLVSGRARMGDVKIAFSEEQHLLMEILQPAGKDLNVSFISLAMAAAIVNAGSLQLTRIVIPALGLPHLDAEVAAHAQIISLQQYWSPDDDYPKELVIATPDKPTYETYVAMMAEMTGRKSMEFRGHLYIASRMPKMADIATIDAIVSHIQQHPAENHTEAMTALFSLTRHPDHQIAEYAREAVAAKLAELQRNRHALKQIPQDPLVVLQDLRAACRKRNKLNVVDLAGMLLKVAKPDLIQELTLDTNPMLRYSIIGQLPQMRDQRFRQAMWLLQEPLLENDLQNPNRDIACDAIVGIAHFAARGDEKAIAKLAELSLSPDAEIRDCALQMIETLKTGARDIFDKMYPGKNTKKS